MPVTLEHFSKLEKKVQELSSRYRELGKDKERLEKELQAARDLAEELEAELGEMKSTRKEALRRVDDLIKKLGTEGSAFGAGSEDGIEA